jgi:uncharacterized protein YecT (DUF1311 family)
VISIKFTSLIAAATIAIAGVAIAVTEAGGKTIGASAAKLSPVVIHETFTPLPCSGKPSHRTTLQQEGCAEQQILRTDAKLNALAKAIFPLLADDAARRRFNTAQRAWLAYRRADCASVSDEFEGGSESPVLAAQCDAARNGVRLKDLRAFDDALSHQG